MSGVRAKRAESEQSERSQSIVGQVRAEWGGVIVMRVKILRKIALNSSGRSQSSVDRVGAKWAGS